jgi:hypothetical protein
MVHSTFSMKWAFLFGICRGDEYLNLNPCRLLCHMEHSIDQCKLVSTHATVCSNFFWSDETKSGTVIDRIREDEYVQISFDEAVEILRVGKNGCEKLCEEHADCVDIGSECKTNGTCLNLFWNRGSPKRSEMSSCYQLSAEGCNDGTPILCGNDKVLQMSDGEASNGSTTSLPSDEEIMQTTIGAQANSSETYARSSVIMTCTLLVIPFFTQYW